MPSPNVNELQEVGRQLAQFVSQSPSRAKEPGVLQGVIADLAAGQPELLAPLRDLVSRQSFQALLPHALSSGGNLQRDALIQEISRVYHPDVLVSIEQVLNGFLDASGGVAVSLSQSVFPSNITTDPRLQEPQSTDPAELSTTQSNSTSQASLASPVGQPRAVASTSPTTDNTAQQYKRLPGKSLRPLLLLAVISGFVGMAALVTDGIRQSSGKSCEEITEELQLYDQVDPSYRSLIDDNKTKCSNYSGFLVQQAILAGNDSRTQEALSLVGKAIQLNPSDSGAFAWQGFLYADAKDYHKALASFDKSIQLVPDNAEAYFGRGLVMFSLDLPLSDVDAAFSKAIKIDPKKSYFFRERANVRLGLKSYQSSLADAEQAIRLDPNDASAYQSRAYAKGWLNDFKGACADIKLAKQKGLKSAPDNNGRDEPIDNVIKEFCV